MAPALVTSVSDLTEYLVTDSSTVDPKAAKGYSERFIHGELYRKFSDVRCVVHSHAESVLPYVISGVPLRPMYHMSGFLGPSVPVFDIAPLYADMRGHQQDMLVNTAELGTALAEHFTSSGSEEATSPDHNVVLMRRHGFTTHGPDIETAMYRAIYTKINAGVQTESTLLRGVWDRLSMKEDAADGMNGGVVNVASKANFELTSLVDDQIAGCQKMNERFQDKPWRLWVREVKNSGLYRNDA